MSLSLLIALILLIIIFACLFAGSYKPQYQRIGSFAIALCALLLFLMAINVLHLR